MFDLYNTLESYNMIDNNEYAYEGIGDKIKKAGSTIWGLLKKIWEGIRNKLGDLGKKIKSAWDFIKRGGKRKIEEVEEYPEEDEADEPSNNQVNKFAKGRGKNIARRKLHNGDSEGDSSTTTKKLPEPSDHEKANMYKNRKLKGGKATLTANGNRSFLAQSHGRKIIRTGPGTTYNADFHPDGHLNRELNSSMNLLLEVATQINTESKLYKMLLSIYSNEAKTGGKIGDIDDLMNTADGYIDKINIMNNQIDDYLIDLENKISNKGYIKLISKIPAVEKYYQKIYTTISKLQQSTGVILNQINKKLDEFKSKYKNYNFTNNNSNGLMVDYSNFKAGSKTGADVHKMILRHTKTLSSYYTRIINITSKMIISPNK